MRVFGCRGSDHRGAPSRALRWTRLALLLLCSAACAQNLGVYAWNGRVHSLETIHQQVRRFGFDTLRIFVGGRYDYRLPQRSPRRFAGVPRPLTLEKILSLPRYRAVLDDPAIRTVWLTAYPVFESADGPDEIDLRRSVPDDDWRTEESQMTAMTEWLYRNYRERDKVILISNHEADVMLREVARATGDLSLAVRNVAQDYQVRFDAVDQVRRRFPGARLKVLFGVEISLWKLHLDEGVNALEAVLPQLAFDFVSFSSWETVTRPDHLPAALEDIRRRTAPTVTAEGRAFFGERHVLVGEFGWAREWRTPLADGRAFMEAALRTPYAIYWQLHDNVEGDDRARQFGLLDPRGRVTCAGQILMERTRPAWKPNPAQRACSATR